MRRFGFAKIDNRIELKGERLLRGSNKTLLNHFKSARRRRIMIARCENCLVDLRRGRNFAFTFAQFFARKINKLITRCNFINQAELQRFQCRMKFSFQDHFRRAFGAN